MKYFIQTFGCQQNVADSERLEAHLQSRGMTKAATIESADHIVINTCMVREKAENRVYGLVNNLASLKEKKPEMKIVVTGCMVGIAFRDKSGAFLAKLKKAMPEVDEFMPIEEVGFDFAPVRTSKTAGWVPISNGCNNFCTFCVVPFTRGREISRPYESIIAECRDLKDKGYHEITLLGQNVNSYGADLILGDENIQVMRDLPDKTYFSREVNDQPKTTDAKSNNADADQQNHTYMINGRTIKPVYVQHLGRKRIPTLFPYLLADVAEMGFKRVDFISSNPWDFSDVLIDVISHHGNITRTIHLPVQHGSNEVLRRMNRWYTREEYIALTDKIRQAIPDVQFTTDIIVGFCDETDDEFDQLVDVCKRVGFYKAYVAMYSSRPMTAATKVMHDNVPHSVKKKRWKILDDMINQPNIADFGKHPHHMHKKRSYETSGKNA